MKALVTGSSGFLGAALVERLLVRGERDIRCFVRSGSDPAPLVALQERFPDAVIEIFTGSLATPASALAALKDVDTVYHAAAGLKGAAADLFLNTVVTSKNLLEAVGQSSLVKMVLISSFGVYGLAKLPRGFVVDENAPLEVHPQRRDLYSYAKLRQEQLFWEYQERLGFPLVVLRPGVIYGPRGSALSSRIGLDLGGIYLHLGGNNTLPLSYVENCAEAIVVAGESDQAIGQVYNVHDDHLPTCAQFLARYKREVKPIRSIPVPFPVAMALSRGVESYHRRSKGQLPAILTPYKTAAIWKGSRFDNSKIKGIGWRQIVPTEEGIRRTFESLRERA